MTPWAWVLLAISTWLAVAAWARWIMAASIRPGVLEATLVWRMYQLYARLIHGLRINGLANIPQPGDQPLGPLIVIANHTAGVDPILIQAALPFEPRWMMASDMRVPALDAMWEFGRIIFVDRRGNDTAALRESLRHLAAGGVLGVFPEGHIERPARHILPFQPGIGLLVSRSKARVLPIVVDGTPICDPAWGSLVKTSRSRVRILPVIDYTHAGLGPAEITQDLRRRFVEATGWPTWDRPPRLVDGEWQWDNPAKEDPRP